MEEQRELKGPEAAVLIIVLGNCFTNTLEPVETRERLETPPGRVFDPGQMRGGHGP